MKTGIARLGMAIGTGLVAAALLALQAASSFAERRSPAEAVALNPLNGMAAEQAAFARFQDEAEDPDQISQAAANTRDLALAAFGAEPLTPKSLMVLAKAEADDAKRGKILELAARLNRRDLALQGAVLEHKVEQADAVGSIGTLDQLLRVHPELTAQFFPPLQDALLKPETERTFAALLDGSSPWHDQFAMFAVRDPGARIRLANIRSEITVENEKFDRDLIAGLATQGEIEQARTLYARAVQTSGAPQEKDSELSWRGDFPPFEWAFIDRRNIRAKPSADGRDLEVYIRPGEGGVIARRLIAPEAAKDGLTIKIDTTRTIREGRMRLAFYCDAAREPALQVNLRGGENSVALDGIEEGCQALRLELYARAYRGEPVFRARIDKITLG